MLAPLFFERYYKAEALPRCSVCGRLYVKVPGDNGKCETHRVPQPLAYAQSEPKRANG